MTFYDYVCKLRGLADMFRGILEGGGMSASRIDGRPHIDVFWDRLSPLARRYLRLAMTPVGNPGPEFEFNYDAALETYLAACVFHEGPKVLRPTAAECFALEEIEVSVPVADYAQPFPTLAVEFPRGFACAREVEGLTFAGDRTVKYHPVACVLRHEPGHQMVMATLVTDDPDNLVLTGTMGHDPTEPLEADLNRVRPNNALWPAETDLQRRCLRAALNACLLLMAGGFRKAGHACNEAYVARLRRRNSAADRRELALIPEVIAFAQDVDVRRAVGPAEAVERSRVRRPGGTFARTGGGLIGGCKSAASDGRSERRSWSSTRWSTATGSRAGTGTRPTSGGDPWRTRISNGATTRSTRGKAARKSVLGVPTATPRPAPTASAPWSGGLRGRGGSPRRRTGGNH